jgi:hypothetical protein
MSISTLSRGMGMSVRMIDATYGHLVREAEDQTAGVLGAYDAADDGRGPCCGHESDDDDNRGEPAQRESPAFAGLLTSG